MTNWAWALAASVALGGLQALEPLISRLRRKSLSVWTSFTSGTSLGYVFLHLLHELLVKGSASIHALVPLGPEPTGTLLLLVLASLVTFYLVGAHGETDGHRAPNALRIGPYVLYNLAIGGALLGEESRNGLWDLSVLLATLGLHLAIGAVGLLEPVPPRQKPAWLAALALAPLAGFLVWSGPAHPHGAFYLLLALISGATLLDSLRTELPAARESHPLIFVSGTALLATLALARWWHP